MVPNATLLLTNRISATGIDPLRARDYWKVVEATDVSELPGLPASEICDRLEDRELGERVARLLDTGTALAVALEELEAKGIAVVPHGDDNYPGRLRKRLGDAAPPLVYAAGPLEWLDVALLGVVGSRNVDEQGAAVARSAAGAAQRVGAGIVSGGARGVDLISMDAAYELGVPSVGVTAEGIERAGRRRELRAAVADGRLLLVSPFAPSAGFSVGNAMGRNKIIYAMAINTLVVASDIESGGTWAGATEALRRKFGPVSVWIGAGAGGGNQPLIDRGGEAVDDLSSWQPPRDVVRSEPPAPEFKAKQLGLDL